MLYIPKLSFSQSIRVNFATIFYFACNYDFIECIRLDFCHICNIWTRNIMVITENEGEIQRKKQKWTRERCEESSVDTEHTTLIRFVDFCFQRSFCTDFFLCFLPFVLLKCRALSALLHYCIIFRYFRFTISLWLIRWLSRYVSVMYFIWETLVKNNRWNVI